jgi:glucokinase
MYAGVDLGATNTRAVVADVDGRILGRDRRSTPHGEGGIAVTEAVLDAIRTACGAADTNANRLQAVGIGSMGPLDAAAGVVDDPPNVPGADRVPLVGPVRNLADTDRVYLHNDANAAVIAERFYADAAPDDMVYLTISSGVGAGVCVDGRVLSGWDGNAGEIGHVTLDPRGEMTCGCGIPGHWEAYCAGSNIPDYARLLHDREDLPTALPLDEPGFDAAAVFAAAGDDPLADRVIDRLADWNSQGFATIVHAYAPLVVRVGGGVALNNPDLVLDPVRERLPDLVMTNVPEIELTGLGEDVVVRGAVASAMTDGTGNRARVDR